MRKPWKPQSKCKKLGGTPILGGLPAKLRGGLPGVKLWIPEGETGVGWCGKAAYPVFTSIGLPTSKIKAVRQMFQWMKERKFLFAARVAPYER